MPSSFPASFTTLCAPTFQFPTSSPAGASVGRTLRVVPIRTQVVYGNPSGIVSVQNGLTTVGFLLGKINGIGKRSAGVVTFAVTLLRVPLVYVNIQEPEDWVKAGTRPDLGREVSHHGTETLVFVGVAEGPSVIVDRGEDVSEEDDDVEGIDEGGEEGGEVGEGDSDVVGLVVLGAMVGVTTVTTIDV